jgi:hypothetical protein
MNVIISSVSIDTQVNKTFNLPIFLNISKNTCVKSAAYQIEFDSNFIDLIEFKEGTIWKDWDIKTTLSNTDNRVILNVLQKDKECSKENKGIILNLFLKAKKKSVSMVKINPFQTQSLLWNSQHSMITIN